MIRKILLFGMAAVLLSIIVSYLCFAEVSIHGMTWIESEKYPGVLSLLGHNSIEEPRINLVFVGYGYEDYEKFMQLVNGLIDYDGVNYGFFSKEPYKSNRDKFNIWVLKDIVYENEHEKFLLRQQKCCLFNEFLVCEIIEEHCPFKNRAIIVLRDYPSSTQGSVLKQQSSLDINVRFGYRNIDVTANSGLGLFYKVAFLHEIGHTFNLWDEYVSFENKDKYIPDGAIDRVNCVIADTIEEAREKAPWKEYIGMGEYPYIIDCYEGGNDYGKGVYRPTLYSLMNSPSPGGYIEENGIRIFLSDEQQRDLQYGIYCETMILDFLNRFIADSISGGSDIYVDSILKKYNPDEEFLEDITKINLLGDSAVAGYSIYENKKIVWSEKRNGNFDIFLYDLESGVESQIAYGESDQISPAIFNNSIVWSEEIDGYFQIILCDIESGTRKQITNQQCDNFSPCIYDGYIAWERSVAALSPNYDIYLYKINEDKEIQITNDKFTQRSPSIYGDKLVWLDNKNSAIDDAMYYDVYCYDIKNGTYLWITEPPNPLPYINYNSCSYRSGLQIFKDKIIWAGMLSFNAELAGYPINILDYAGIFGNYDIFVYDLNTKEQIQLSRDYVCQTSPYIFDDKVVYISDKSGNREVYMYDMKEKKELRVTSDGSPKYKPVIYDDLILWLKDGRIVLNYNRKDTFLPITTSSGIDGNWHTGPVAVTLTATDEGSGVDKTYYSTDGTEPKTLYTAPFTLSKDGIYSIKYYSVDMTGNKELVKTASKQVKIDTTPPTGMVKINNDAVNTTSIYVTLTLSATDTGSGVSQMKFSNDNTTWSAEEAYIATKSWTLSSGNGTKTVYVKFKDGAGNWSMEVRDSIILGDTTPPTGTVKINNDAVKTTSIYVTLTLSAADTGSDVSQMKFSNDNTTWSAEEAYIATKSWTLSSGNGTKTVYVKFKDGAGNWSMEVRDSIVILPDTTPPMGTVKINNNARYTISTSVTLNLSATDRENGITQMRFYNTNSYRWLTPEPYSTSKSWTLSSDNGAKTVYVKFKDGAGNWSMEVRDSIILDTIPPAGMVKINNNAKYTISNFVILNLSAGDIGSGVSQMKFSNDNTTWSAEEAYIATKSWTLSSGNGTKTVYVKFKDGAGNWSMKASDSIIKK